LELDSAKEDEFNVSVDDMESLDGQSNDSHNLQQDSEINMSLCLDAFKALEPKDLS